MAILFSGDHGSVTRKSRSKTHVTAAEDTAEIIPAEIKRLLH
jgi:hypothetical protein